MTSEARNEGSLRRMVLLAFAKWSPCVYMGTTICDECPRKDYSDGDTCDMYHGRTGHQKAFEAGWDHKQNPRADGRGKEGAT